MVAVDFTVSNGDPQSSDSLHYTGYSSILNAYQEAIMAIMEVGEVLQFYDNNKRFPAWGFGGKLNDGPVSHCFNLSGNDDNCEVEGVQGIMDAYKNALHTVTLQGPTLFGQVINKAADIGAQSLSTNPTKYFDGVLTDLQETKDAIVRASDLPLSILIVGVGKADFKQMKILDADTGPPLKSSTGRIAARDIVHFVPMRDVPHGSKSSIYGEKLMVQALLEELPGQFLTYMRGKDIKPLGIDKAPLPVDPLIT
ncbi:putative copine, protein BONZAI, von Willebrand factor A-like domain superfamily [Helianthus annuus]|nr:putative copine, protein BONZAI, von Willebrand factor A-like domain superfamily [Helianthus annuus]